MKKILIILVFLLSGMFTIGQNFVVNNLYLRNMMQIGATADNCKITPNAGSGMTMSAEAGRSQAILYKDFLNLYHESVTGDTSITLEINNSYFNFILSHGTSGKESMLSILDDSISVHGTNNIGTFNIGSNYSTDKWNLKVYGNTIFKGNTTMNGGATFSNPRLNYFSLTEDTINMIGVLRNNGNPISGGHLLFKKNQYNATAALAPTTNLIFGYPLRSTISGDSTIVDASVIDLASLGLAAVGSSNTFTQPNTFTTINATTLSGATLDETNILPIWKSITSPTITNDSTFTFAGSYLDVQKYNRSIFTCLDSEKVVTTWAGHSSSYLVFSGRTNYKVGDIIWFTNGTMPTISAGDALIKGRAYFIQTIAKGATKDSILISETIGGTAFTTTSAGTAVKLRKSIIGYIYNIATSGGTVTATVHTSMLSGATGVKMLTVKDSLFRVQNYKKMMDYLFQSYTGANGIMADASNAQGKILLNFPTNAYLLAVNVAVLTAATGAGHLTYNIYSNTTPLFTAAPDLTTKTAWNSSPGWLQEFPDIKYIAQGSNISQRVMSSSGTVVAKFFETDLYLVPVYIFAIP